MLMLRSFTFGQIMLKESSKGSQKENVSLKKNKGLPTLLFLSPSVNNLRKKVQFNVMKAT